MMASSADAGRRHDSKYNGRWDSKAEKIYEDARYYAGTAEIAWNLLGGLIRGLNSGHLQGEQRTHECEGVSTFSKGRRGTASSNINGACVYRSRGPGTQLNTW